MSDNAIGITCEDYSKSFIQETNYGLKSYTTKRKCQRYYKNYLKSHSNNEHILDYFKCLLYLKKIRVQKKLMTIFEKREGFWYSYDQMSIWVMLILHSMASFEMFYSDFFFFFFVTEYLFWIVRNHQIVWWNENK